MTKLSQRSKKEDIVKERENGTLCPANDLGLVNKDELIRYICYLTTELAAADKAINKLTSCFAKNIADLTIAHEESIKELSSSIQLINVCKDNLITENLKLSNETAGLQVSVENIKQLNAKNTEGDKTLHSKLSGLQKSIDNLQIGSDNKVTPTMNPVPLSSKDKEYIDNIKPHQVVQLVSKCEL